MAMAAAARRLLRGASGGISSSTFTRTPLATVCCYRCLNSMPRWKLTGLAEELVKVLKEPSSEVNTDKVQALFKELSRSFQKAPAEQVPHLSIQDISIRDLSVKLNKVESWLNVHTNFVFGMASIFAAAFLAERTCVNKVELKVGNLDKKLKTTDASLASLDKKIYQHDCRFEEMKPKDRCPMCKSHMAVPEVCSPEDSSPGSKSSPEDGAKGF